MDRIREQLTLTEAQIQKISDDFLTEMKNGLDGSESSIQMIPTFITSLPTGKEYGEYIALDLGGTNFRVVKVTLDGKKGVHIDDYKHKVPLECLESPYINLFDFLAERIAELKPAKMTPLGFTFSFPVNNTSVKCGTILRWTKGFNLPDCIGMDPVELLRISLLNKGIELDVCCLANDTVGTLLSNCIDYPDTTLGVILGTGHNIAYLEETVNIKKGDFTKDERMIICMESGAFKRGLSDITTDEDNALDACTPNVGCQINEKMISGMYLGELLRLFLNTLMKSNQVFTKAVIDKDSALHTYLAIDTSDLTEMLSGEERFSRVMQKIKIRNYSEEDMSIILDLIHLIMVRSAQLVSIQIVTIMRHIKKESSTVGIDGSLYTLFPGYKELVQKYVTQFGGQAKLVYSGDGSGKGAAILAAAISGKIAK